jgi:predicted  nucleic acid-binding Zn-ribbon protein
MTLDESKRLSDEITRNKNQLDKLRADIKQKKEKEHELLTDINKRTFVLHENFKEINKLADQINGRRVIESNEKIDLTTLVDIESALDVNMALIRELCTQIDNEIFQLEDKDTKVRFELNGLEREIWDISAKIEEIRLNIEELRGSEEKIKQKTMDNAKVSLEYRNDLTNSIFYLDKEISTIHDSLTTKRNEYDKLTGEVEKLSDELKKMETDLLTEKDNGVKTLMNFKNDVQHLLKVRINKNVKIIEGLNEQECSVDQ